jgi:hypothetical protein
MKLTPKELHVAASALRLASHQYMRDAESASVVVGWERIRDGFIKQAQEAEKLAEKIEEYEEE